MNDSVTTNSSLEMIFSDAIDYINEHKKYTLLGSIDSKTQQTHPLTFNEFLEKINHLNRHKFVIFLKKHLGFITAKQMLVDNKFIFPDTRSSQKQTVSDLIHTHALEFIIANAVCQCFSSDLNQSIVVKKENKFISEKLYDKLTKMSRNFELEAEEQMFIKLLNRLKKSTGNIYNTGKSHTLIIRELMTKRIIQQLYFVFRDREITQTFASEITLRVTSIFFEEEMSRSDMISLAKSIIQNIKDSSKIYNMTIWDYIYS